MNRIALAIVVLLVLAGNPPSACANEPHDLPDAFMKSLLEGNTAAAVDQFMATNPMIAEKKQQLQMVKTQIDGAFQMFGKPFAMEVIAVDDLAPSLRRFVFITKHENGPLTWEFYVYKPRDAWIAANLTFNDNFGLTAPRK